jgi:hypothetical protein
MTDTAAAFRELFARYRTRIEQHIRKLIPAGARDDHRRIGPSHASSEILTRCCIATLWYDRNWFADASSEGQILLAFRPGERATKQEQTIGASRRCGTLFTPNQASYPARERLGRAMPRSTRRASFLLGALMFAGS